MELDPAVASKRAPTSEHAPKCGRASSVAHARRAWRPTRDSLTDSVKRPPDAQVPTPLSCFSTNPRAPFSSHRAVASAFREARRGGAAGLSGIVPALGLST